MAEQHDTVGLPQCLGDLIVERQIFRRALPVFTQFVAMVQVMQEMMRIVRPDRFGTLI